MRFGLNGKPEMTLREVGEELAIGRDRVYQIERVALLKLRNLAVLQKFRDYLD
ncbi:hypothetical protein HY025_06015 [Candidatus Daviesbacteria bacterium]|nr:hypothetical protein [Candidatus Daviesbacteria bacterium]